MDPRKRKADYKKKKSHRQSVVEDVNKKADEFIRSFRQQLKSEHEESLRRRRERIARGKRVQALETMT